MDGWADEKRTATDPNTEKGIRHILWVKKREEDYKKGESGVGGKGWAGTFSSTFWFSMKKKRGLGEWLCKETGQLNGKTSGPRCASKSRVGKASLQLQKVKQSSIQPSSRAHSGMGGSRSPEEGPPCTDMAGQQGPQSMQRFFHLSTVRALRDFKRLSYIFSPVWIMFYFSMLYGNDEVIGQ